MTLQEFDSALKAVCPDTYELAAPKGLSRYVVWAKYGVQSAFGDDMNVVDLPKVQIDIVSDIPDDTLVEEICAVLWLACLTYSVESTGYDPDYNANRTILQLVVV